MTDFFKMDVFFVTTTCAVVLVTILLIVVLIRVLRILKSVEEESKLLREDIAEVRRTIKGGGFSIIKSLFNFGAKKRSRRASKDT